MKFELHAVHLDKENKLSVGYKLLEVENSAQVQAGPFTALVHHDLIDAMAKLSPHIALMTGQIDLLDYDSADDIPPATVENFNAKSFSESGDGDKLKIVISGNRKNVFGKVFNFNTPAFLVNQDSDSDSYYELIDEVKKWVARIKVETLAFLDGSKRGKDPQGNLFAANGQGSAANPAKAVITKIQVAPPDTKKEWTPGEYLDEISDEPGAKKFLDKSAKADPDAMERVKQWEASEKAENGPKKAAVANQPGGKGRKAGGVKRVKQTPENRSGIIDETGENDSE